jgi:DNA-directed RNA polymerase specialized sigma24 family protein
LLRDLRSAVRSEIRLLPGVFRQVLTLRYLDGMELSDIAQRLDLNVATFKSRLLKGNLSIGRRVTVPALQRFVPSLHQTLHR